MPDWTRTLKVAGLLCLPLIYGVCQDDQATHHPPRQSSLAHYRAAENYLQAGNLQSAADELREALNGDLDAPWTGVWSHIQLGRIFDASGQHDRAIAEYKEVQRTGDNTDGALDEANDYLRLAADGIYLASPYRPVPVKPIQGMDPEYTDEARLAGLEGTVVLGGVIDEQGFPQNLRVVTPLGLGLDEKAVDAAKQWHFEPGIKPPYRIYAEISVAFRPPSKQSRWHLIGVRFSTPAGVTRPIFMSAFYPIGAGIGPDAMEEGRVLVAIGRLATAELTFDVNEQGVPANFRAPNASMEIWGSEATALVRQWRFMPGTKNGIPVPVPCTLDLVWGQRQLTSDLERQLHEVLPPR